MFFATHTAMGRPERNDGAYAVDAFLRCSHFSASGSPKEQVLLEVVSDAAVLGVLSSIPCACVSARAPDEEKTVWRNTDRGNQAPSSVTPTGREPLTYSL